MTYFWQDMRNLRLAYKQEEQNRLEIFENLVTRAFPVSNGLVRLQVQRKVSGSVLSWMCRWGNWKCWETDAEVLIYKICYRAGKLLWHCLLFALVKYYATSCYQWSFSRFVQNSLDFPNNMIKNHVISLVFCSR